MILSGCTKDVKNQVLVTEAPKIQVKNTTDIEKDKDISIITTDRFVFNMVKKLIKNKNNVDFIFKNREDEFNYKYSSDSLANIAKKDLFLYVGADFEPWISKYVDKLSKSKVSVVNISRGINILDLSNDVKVNDYVMKENPYYWLNVDNYKVALLNIKNSIQDLDAKNFDFYESNYNDYTKEVQTYEKKLKDLSDATKNYMFVYNEDSLDYFVKYSSIKTLKLDTNGASKDDIQKLENKIKDYNNNVIFLYDNDVNNIKNMELIKKYSLKIVNVKTYKDDFVYTDLIQEAVDNIKKSITSK